MTEAIDDFVGRAVQRARVDQGWSQADLAQRLSSAGLPIRQQTVATIENGTRPLKLAEAVVLADLLGITIAQLAAPEEVAAVARELQLHLAAVSRAQDDLADAVGAYATVRAELASALAAADSIGDPQLDLAIERARAVERQGDTREVARAVVDWRLRRGEADGSGA